MTSERWVLLGLAQPRAEWFGQVARWTTTGVLAAEFVKCVSTEEVRARLASARTFSALLVDAAAPWFDRDLVAAAQAAGVAVLAVGPGRGARWSAGDLGVAAVLAADFDSGALVDALEHAARPVPTATSTPPGLDDEGSGGWQGRLVAVCGTGGAGTSTVAVALAQAGGSDARYGASVALADLARRADLAVVHDAPVASPGLQELVEAHRLGRPSSGDVRALTLEVPERRYRLLAGLRRPTAWAALRPRAVDAGLRGLRRSFQLVVAQVEADFEGEADGGSLDVEERNHLARSAVAAADVVVVCGRPGLTGASALGRLLEEVVAAGAQGSRVVPVVVRAPRSPRARADLARAVAAASPRAPGVASPVWVPDRDPELALRDGTPLPSALVRPLASAVGRVLDAHSDAAPPVAQPERIVPGSLGQWAEEDV